MSNSTANTPLVLFEDNHLIAVFKNAGQTVQPEPGKPVSLEEQVKDYLRIKYLKTGNVFLGVIHRLDMPVSGLVLFARTSKALARMNEIFRKREVQKYYQAWVENHPPDESALLTHWLKRDEKKNFTKAFESEVKDSSVARLKYRFVKEKGGYSLLEIELLTGRKHQIRAQLSAAGCPIAGDRKYGAATAFRDEHIALQSVGLAFTHPVTNEPVQIHAPNLPFPF